MENLTISYFSIWLPLLFSDIYLFITENLRFWGIWGSNHPLQSLITHMVMQNMFKYGSMYLPPTLFVIYMSNFNYHLDFQLPLLGTPVHTWDPTSISVSWELQVLTKWVYEINRIISPNINGFVFLTPYFKIWPFLPIFLIFEGQEMAKDNCTRYTDNQCRPAKFSKVQCGRFFKTIASTRGATMVGAEGKFLTFGPFRLP